MLGGRREPVYFTAMIKRASPHIKICGLRTIADLKTAIEAGARWVGFVHFENSPRHVSRQEGKALVEAAQAMSQDIETVVLLVNPSAEAAAELAEDWGVDHIQLHGQETNEMIHRLRGLRPSGEIWKALPVSSRDDLKTVKAYPAADRFLFDARPPKDADRPGGWGHSFDWTLLKGFSCDKPWLLAGGLSPDNVAEACVTSGAKAVDVSSGVEAQKGVKDDALIRSFCKNAQGAG